MKRLSEKMKLLFGYGIELVLFAGGFTFFGYVIALLIGGDTAAAICTWLYKTLIPVIVKLSTILILFGLLAMYFAGEKALTPEKSKKEGQSEN